MIAFMLGEEKRAKPKPKNNRAATMAETEVLFPRKVKKKSPAAVIAIPMEDIIRGSILSDNRPARGEKSAIIIG